MVKKPKWNLNLPKWNLNEKQVCYACTIPIPKLPKYYLGIYYIYLSSIYLGYLGLLGSFLKNSWYKKSPIFTSFLAFFTVTQTNSIFNLNNLINLNGGLQKW